MGPLSHAPDSSPKKLYLSGLFLFSLTSNVSVIICVLFKSPQDNYLTHIISGTVWDSINFLNKAHGLKHGTFFFLGMSFLYIIFGAWLSMSTLDFETRKWHRKECFSPFSERCFDWQIQLACRITFPFVPRGVGTSFSGKIWNIFLRIVLSNEINFT